MTRFQLIFTGVLIALGIAGAVMFSISKSSSSQGAPALAMWGTLDQAQVNAFLSTIEPNNKATINVTYTQVDPTQFESSLISALADGNGPDLVLLPQDLILKQLSKWYEVPFAQYSERTFKSSFIQEGEMYLTPTGILGFPFAVDPMVMYWNRDMFNNAGIANPPTTWSQLFTLAPSLTAKDQNGDITQSAIAMGESANVLHYKDMIALLAIQAGTPIVAADSQGSLTSVFDERQTGAVTSPAESAISFFAQFSDPAKDSYSWNRALPIDRTDFVAGKLAVYFGYASELPLIRSANPNLNFDVAGVPQADSGTKATFGNMDAVTVLKSSKNLTAAVVAAAALTTQAMQQEWVTETGYPPVRRDLLTTLPGDAYQATFWRSALVSTSWLDPNSQQTSQIFADMVDSVNSGKLRASEAVTQASTEIQALLNAEQAQ